jgi:hypothetical protein
VGIQEVHNKVKVENVELVRRDYVANEGWETFLSYEDPKQDILVLMFGEWKVCSFFLITISSLPLPISNGTKRPWIVRIYTLIDSWIEEVLVGELPPIAQTHNQTFDYVHPLLFFFSSL